MKRVKSALVIVAATAATMTLLELYVNHIGEKFYREWLRLLLEEYEAEVYARKVKETLADVAKFSVYEVPENDG